MPIDKCIANAAGGTSQRLKSGPAVMCSLDRKSAMPTPKYLIFSILLLSEDLSYIVLQIIKNGNRVCV